MKTYKIEYQRIESCEIEINAESKKDAKFIFTEQAYDLELEKVNEISHKLKRVTLK